MKHIDVFQVGRVLYGLITKYHTILTYPVDRISCSRLPLLVSRGTINNDRRDSKLHYWL